MKRSILLVVIIAASLIGNSQDFKFYENFDTIPYGNKVSSSNTGAGQWGICTSLSVSGQRSDSCVVPTNDTVYLTSNAFSTVGFTSIFLEFSHICKIEFNDFAEIQVSNNNGATWTKLTAAQYMGIGQFGSISDRFSCVSYVTDWDATNPSAIPTNAWWKGEKFNIGSLIGNSSQARIRFALSDQNNNGANGNYGWLLDDIRVWTPSAQEATMIGFELPFSLPSGCGLTNETIRVKILNSGGSPINGNITASFRREGQLSVTESVPNQIATGDTLAYTFTNKIDLYSSIDTNYRVWVWVKVIGDPNASNDTLMDTVASRVPLAPPVSPDVTIPFGTSTTLYATHIDSLSWYSDPQAQTLLKFGANYTTPILYDTTTFYVQAGGNTGSGTNLALQGVATHSGGGSGTYGPAIYNDGLIPACASATAGDWGWVTSNGWIEYTWTTPQTFTKVVFYKANRPMTSCTFQYWDGSAYVNFFSYNSAIPCEDSVTFPPVTTTKLRFNTIAGSTNPNHREIQVFGGSSNTGVCPSIAKAVKVMTSGMPVYNAGLTSIIKPFGAYTQGDTSSVVVTLKNYASAPLTKVTINHSINGVAQAPYLWTGSLPYNQTVTVTLGTDTFQSGTYAYKAWTDLPNDSLDQFPANDTATSNAYVCLSGTFTLGDASSDFPTIASLQTVLTNVGICGNTIIRMKPGTYAGPFAFPAILGASQSNRLTFESYSGLNTDVIIEHTGVAAADNYTIKLDGADYLTFRNLTIRNNGTTYGYVVHILNGANYNTFENNRMFSGGNTSSTTAIIYDASASLDHFNQYINNNMTGGYYGIYSYGTASSPATSWQKGTVIRGNTLVGNNIYPMLIYYGDSIIIDNNIISGGVSTYSYGISAMYLNNGYRVTRNKISLVAATTTATYGIRDYYSNYTSYNASPTGLGLIANNMVDISITTAGSHYGIYGYYSSGSRYYYNSVNITGVASTTSYAFNQGNTSVNLLKQSFLNNVFSNKAGGYALYVADTGRVGTCNYNDLHSTGTALTYWVSARANLTAHQSASSRDANSKSVDPNFTANNDLHINSITLNAAATPVPEVLFDFDGQLRDTLTPDIGADEIYLSPNDAGVFAVLEPVAPCPGDTVDVKVRVRNFGTAALNSLTINWTVNDTLQTSFAIPDTIPSFTNKDYVIGSYIFQSGISYTLKFYTSAPNGAVDGQFTNDTLLIPVFKTAMTGNYTIGATGSDFSSFTAAAAELALTGVCGPVVFSVSAGTYTEQFTIAQITGASAINTITFEGASNDSTSATLTFSQTSAANHIVWLNGADYVTFRHLKFVSPGANYGIAIKLNNAASYNKVLNCHFVGSNPPNGQSSPYDAAIIYASFGNNTQDINNVYRNNYFYKGYCGIIDNNTSSANEPGLEITNNVFVDQRYIAVSIYSLKSPVITGNTVRLTQPSATSSILHGFYAYRCSEGLTLTNNKVHVSSASPNGNGIYIRESNGTSTKPILIANNFISLEGNNGLSTGINISANTASYSVLFAKVYNNSVNITGLAPTSKALLLEKGVGTLADIVLRNNALANQAGGFAIYTDATTGYNSNYNDLFTTGANLGYNGANRANLGAWVTATGQDSNSVSASPSYFSITDLHTVSSALDGKAIPLAEVTTDIDGEARHASTPDIGADEFTPPPFEAGLATIISPENGCGLDTVLVTIAIVNNGLDTIMGGLTASYQLIGSATVITESITATILPADTLYHNFATQANLSTTVDSTFVIKAWIALTADPVQINDTLQRTVFNGVIPAAPVISNATIVYGTTASLSATSTGTTRWYGSFGATTPIWVGANYTTPILFDTTMYYLATLSANGCMSPQVPVTVFVTNIPAGDVGISKIFINQGCGLDSTEDITIEVYNQGYATVTSNLTASYRIDNNAWKTPESITLPIAPNDTIQYTFTAKANLYAYVADTMFKVKAYVSLLGDNYQLNDSILEDTVKSKYTTQNPVVVSPVSIAYGANATLSATSNDTILWFQNLNDSLPVGGGPTYFTPALYSSTTYYAQAGKPFAGSGGNIAPLSTITGVGLSTGTLDWTRCYDGDTGTTTSGQQCWISTATPPNGTEYWDWNWTQPHTISGVKFYIASITARTLTGATFQIWNGSTWVNHFTWVQPQGSFSFTINFPPVSTTKLRCTSFQMTGTGQLSNPNFREIEVYESAPSACPSARIPVLVNVAPPPPIDAGVVSIDNPVGSTPSGQPTPIVVRIKNFGTSPLVSANLTYRLNGVVKATYAWTGSVLYGDTSAPITIYTDTFAGGMYNICVWTSLANGTGQGVNSNDTLCSTFNACLNGTYTLGTASSDFPTFTHAFAALTNAGICGHVVFNVAPGTYNNQLTITAIAGMGPNATITFQGTPGDSTAVVLQTAGTSTANWTIKLDGADYFTFRNMTIRNNDATYGRVVEVINGAMYNKFISNKMVSGGASSSTTGVIYDGTTLNHYNQYINNYMQGGYYTIYNSGSGTTSWEKGTVIKGNEIVGSYLYPMYVYYADSVQIVDNYIHDGVAPYSYGIHAYYINNKYRITGNRVYITATSTSACYGLRDYYGNNITYNANPTGYGLVANNMVSIQGGTAAHYGMYAYYSNGTEYYYNTVQVSGGSSAGYTMYQGNTSNNTLGQIFKNNIFVNLSGGYAAYFGTPAQVTICDNNCYYSNGANLAYWNAAVANLAALKLAAPAMNQNSVSLLPDFFSANNLHLMSTSLSGLASPVALVNIDIDGQARSSSMPTIGADEVPLLPVDAGVNFAYRPNSIENEGTSIPIVLRIKNFGTDTLHSIPINYYVPGTSISVNQTWTGSLSSGDTVQVTMPNMTVPAGSRQFCAKTMVVGDSNAFNDQTCLNFYGTPIQDAWVTKVLDIAEGCGLGLDTVIIRIKNIGYQTIPSGFTAKYKEEDGTNIISATVNQSIAPNDSIIFAFPTLFDFSVTTFDSIFRIIAWVDVPADNVEINDTNSTKVNSKYIPAPPTTTSPVTVPYASPATLMASSTTGATIFWYDSLSSQTELDTGNVFVTPLMYNTDTFYVAAGAGSGSSGGMIPELLYYNFNTPGTTVPNLASNPVGTNPAPISGAGLTIGGSGQYGTALVGTGTGGVINTGWLTNLNGSFTLSFWTKDIPASSTLWYIWGDAGATSFRCFTNGAAGANNWMVRGGGLPDLTIPGVATMAANTIHVVYDAPAGQLRGYRDGVLVISVTAPTSNVMAGTGFQIGAYGTSGYLSGLMDEFRIYNRALTPAEILQSLTGAGSSGGCQSQRVPVIVNVGNQAQYDAGAYLISAPVSAVNLTSAEVVKVKVRNYGLQSITNFQVSYKVNNLTTITETVAGPLASGDSMTYTFTTPVNLSSPGVTYQMKAWTTVTGDVTSINDTAYNNNITNMIPNYCPCAATSALYMDITRVKVSNLDNSSTPSGTLYTDFTSVAPALMSIGSIDSIRVNSDFVNTTTTYATWVNVFVDWNRDGTFDPIAERIFSQAGTSQASLADTFSIPATAIPGLTRMRVVLRQTGTAANTGPCGTFTYGEAEDYTVQVQPMIPNDAGVMAIVSPTSTVSGGVSVPFSAVVRNYGTQPILPGQLQVKFQLDNSPIVTVTVQTTLQSLDTLTVTAGSFPVPTGQHQLCIWTVLANDTNVFNDQKCMGVFGELYTTLPYADNFEGVVYWNANGTKGNWQHGVPAGTTINTAHSPTKVWKTKLSGYYDNGANELLYTPRFNFAGLLPTDTATLKFWHWYATETANDGGQLQYSVNGGQTWITLGTIGDPDATNWYVTNIGGSHVFSGSSSGWVQSTIKLNPAVFNGQSLVQFRFRFFSNATTNSYDGWAIDDFAITLPIQPNDVGVDAIISPPGGSITGSQVTVTVNLKNFGSNTQTSFPVSYKVNNLPPVTQTWTGSLAYNATTNFSFTVPFTSPNTTYQLCAYTSLSNDAFLPNDQVCASQAALPAPFDAGVVEVVNPKDSVCRDQWQKPVIVKVANFGTSTLTSMNLQYQINSVTPIIEAWTGSLLPGDTMTYTFSALYNPPIGVFMMCAQTNLGLDANTANDKSCNTVKSVICLGIDENGLAGMDLGQNRPNPASDLTQIDITLPADGKLLFEVVNLLGQVIESKQISGVEGTQTIELNLANMESGVYYYTIRFNGYSITRKMVVE